MTMTPRLDELQAQYHRLINSMEFAYAMGDRERSVRILDFNRCSTVSASCGARSSLCNGSRSRPERRRVPPLQ
jgi:hypothetical protein